MNENHDAKGQFASGNAAGAGMSTHDQGHQDLHSQTVSQPLREAQNHLKDRQSYLKMAVARAQAAPSQVNREKAKRAENLVHSASRNLARVEQQR